MSDADNGVEYVFILPNGEERYEIVFSSFDMFQFQEMHGAKSAMPLKTHEERKAKNELIN